MWSFHDAAFAEDGKEMYQELKRTCIAIVLLIKASRSRCRRVLRKVPTGIICMITDRIGLHSVLLPLLII